VSEEESKGLRSRERTGRPLEDDDFLVRLQKNLGHVCDARNPDGNPSGDRNWEAVPGIVRNLVRRRSVKILATADAVADPTASWKVR
jgi:hypothetical protein